LSTQVYVEESAAAFFNLAVLNDKSNALTIHPSLSAAWGRSGGWQSLTGHLSPKKTEGINAITNSIDGNASIAIYIDARKG
jgi:hypothetical protein